MTSTPETDAWQSPRRPRRGEQAIYDQALSFGGESGRSYPWIWDSAPEVVRNVYAGTRTSILGIGGAVPTRAAYRIITWVAFTLLVVSIISVSASLSGMPMELRSDHVDLMFLPLTLVIVWGLTFFVGRGVLNLVVRNRLARHAWLTDVACQTAFDVIEDRRNAAYDYFPGASGEAFEPQGPAPLPQPYGVSDIGAAELAAAWMKFLGAADARSMDPAAGTNAQSSNYVAFVDNGAQPTIISRIRELAGVAAVARRRAIFFSAAGFTDEARQFADQADISLLILNATAGTLTGANLPGGAVFRTGL
jgi:hypothetical protein